ncbi:MAG TPA: FtsQ-type POTRA domain-containing protein [Burkholderiales bacterium]|nr:FtsQ-type POTRA domain-containing protein [Burkholderiales bacterium]
MWGNPRLLNAVAGFLVGVTLLALLVAALHALLRSPLFPVREVLVVSPVAHVTRAQLETALEQRIAGNFFAVDVGEVRAAVETLPWVRRAAVRKVWPDRLEVAIEEHVALARWAQGGLVNTFGERFPGRAEEDLPLFVAPEGSEIELAHQYLRFALALEPLGASLERVVLTSRFAWQLRLGNGLHLMLGRDAEAAELRLHRFVSAYPGTLERLQGRHQVVDLRYPNGFAVRVAPRGS